MKIVALALALAAIPFTATAQNPAADAAMRNTEVHRFQERFSQNLQAQAMDEQSDRYRETQNPRRVRRAEQAAALINAGDCAGAREIATRANDDRLRLRIEEVCSADQAAASNAASTGH